MSLKDDFDAALAKIDDATNAVSARLDRLSQQITNSMTDAQVADVKAKLAAESDRLSAMGKDPENPTPVPEPTPTP